MSPKGVLCLLMISVASILVACGKISDISFAAMTSAVTSIFAIVHSKQELHQSLGVAGEGNGRPSV